MKHWPSILLLAAWLPFAASLWPLPSEEGARDFSAAWVSLAKQGEKGRSFFDKNEREEMDSTIRWLSDPENILMEWRIRWITHALVLLLALGSIALAIFRTKGWKVVIVFASSSYLILVHGFPFRRALRWEQWQGWWIMATEYPQWGLGAVYSEILFPLFHIILIAVFVVIAAITIRNRSNPSLN